MKNYLKVPFADKDEVKSLGARWDMEMKSWYAPDDADKSTFSKWESHDPSVRTEQTGTKVYLTVPFSEKDEVKAAGGRWDNDKKMWYHFSDANASAFSKWLSSDQPSAGQSTAKSGGKSSGSSQSNNSGNDDLDDLDAILSLGDD